MAFSLGSIVSSVTNGFANAEKVYTDWLMDNRPTNTANPRIQSSDPTQAIDSGSSLNLLSFPLDRPKYYITFGFEEYRRPTQFEGLSSNGVTDYICLPLPHNLQDNNHFNYNPMEGSIINEAMTESGRAIADAVSQSLLQGSIDPLKESAGNVSNGIAGAASGIGINSGVNLGRKIESIIKGSSPNSQSMVDGALQIAGLTQNPFNTIAFSGPNFKTHQFSWMMAPKSPQESEMLRKIIYTFKKVAHPELLTMAAGGFFKYPWIVWPKFMPDALQTNLYTFKPCVITDINIDYSPQGYVGFFGGTQAPVRAQISMQLLEIEIWRKGNGDGFGITNGDFRDPTIPDPPTSTNTPKDLGTI